MQQQEPAQVQHSHTQSQVRLLPVSKIIDIWPKVYSLIKKAVDKSDGSITMDIIYDNLLSQNSQLWISKTLIAVTEITIYPNGNKYLTFLICSGRKFDKKLIDPIIDWSKNHGCQGCEIYGREGWKRKLKDFKPVHLLLRKEYYVQ